MPMLGPREGMWSLTDVPSDVLVLVAKALLPYDLLSLSSTCLLLRPLLRDKGLWLSIATSLSFHRPLPFTASQALALPVETIFRTCLRTERVAKKWSWNLDLRPKPEDAHVKIAFPDKRNIPYFTILPGARRIMAFDVKNTLSCWSTAGELLGTYNVRRGARLTRWKPIDESDSQFDSSGGAMQYTVEVMVEHMSLQMRTTRYEVILLKYDDIGATFTLHEQFRLPSVYEPDSAMSQDELWGALVHFSGDHTERFGIYLVDRTAKKAVCIDPGVVPEFPPQALISSKYLVLYWETSRGPRSYAYKMSTLRSIIATHGLHCDGDELHENISIPVQIPPDEEYFSSFHTVRRPVSEAKPIEGTNGSSSSHEDALANTEEVDFIDEDTMMRNSDWYPIVIPKWTTMKDDLTAHWTRSVMTLSRRPPIGGVHNNGMGPGIFVNGVLQPFPIPNAPGWPAEGAQDGAGNAPGPVQFGLNIPQIVQMAAAQAQALFNAQLNNNPPHAPGAAANGVHAPQVPQQQQQPPPPTAPQADALEQEGDMPALLDVSDDSDDDINMDGDEDELMDDAEEEEDDDDDDLPPLFPAADEFPPPDPNAPPEPPPPPMPNNFGHFHVHQGRPPARLMTITHHYYSFTDKDPQIKRTLIAEARIRQPRHAPHVGIVGFDVVLDGPGAANMQFLPFGMAGANGGGANGAANGNPGAVPPGAGMPGGFPGAFGFGGGLPGWANGQPQPPAGNPVGGQGPLLGGFGLGPLFMGWNMAAPPVEGNQPVGAGGGGLGQNGAGAVPGAVPVMPDGFHLQPFAPPPAGFPENAPGLVDFAPEEFGGGTPVMGYGGRCALWVQEGDEGSAPQGSRRTNRDGIVKIATFPSHALRDIPVERQTSLLDSYTSLERVGGNLCTVHIPECVDVENALAFDLDDVRGVVGVSNSKGEIWLVDYS